MNTKILQLVLAVWAGGLVTICGLVAPSLFTLLSDRHTAGQVAAHFFRLESWLGLLFAGAALALMSKGPLALRNPVNYALAVVTAAGPISNEIVVRPFMDSALAANEMKLFGLLHGAGALFFGFACLTSLILIWRVTARDALQTNAP